MYKCERISGKYLAAIHLVSHPGPIPAEKPEYCTTSVLRTNSWANAGVLHLFNALAQFLRKAYELHHFCAADQTRHKMRTRGVDSRKKKARNPERHSTPVSSGCNQENLETGRPWSKCRVVNLRSVLEAVKGCLYKALQPILALAHCLPKGSIWISEETYMNKIIFFRFQQFLITRCIIDL